MLRPWNAPSVGKHRFFFAFVSRHLLVFKGKVEGSQHQLVFQAVASGEFVQGFSLVTRTINFNTSHFFNSWKSFVKEKSRGETEEVQCEIKGWWSNESMKCQWQSMILSNYLVKIVRSYTTFQWCVLVSPSENPLKSGIRTMVQSHAPKTIPMNHWLISFPSLSGCANSNNPNDTTTYSSGYEFSESHRKKTLGENHSLMCCVYVGFHSELSKL